MKEIPDTMDFEQWARDDDDGRADVRPASQWCDEVVQHFHGDRVEVQGQRTPWSKVGEQLRFRPGEVTAWAGINGHGKTGAVNFVMLGAMVDGAKVCVASLEILPVLTMRNLTRQAVGAGFPTVEAISAFHRWTDDRLWLYAHRGKLTPERMLAVVRYCRKELGIEHIVIDSLMKCGIAPDDYAGQKDFVDALCVLARDTRIHVHLVCHMKKGERETDTPDKFSVKGAGEITDLVDNVVIVFRNKRKEAQMEGETDADKLEALEALPDCTLICPKQRHYSWEGRIALWFDRKSLQLLESPKSARQYIDFSANEWRQEWKR
jgi:twinkle protein